jgi:hypothetical protein
MKTIITDLPKRESYRRGKYSVEIGYPWLALGAILTLETIVVPEFNILEFGCGGSTVFFSRRAKSVLSLETDRGWFLKLKEQGLENVTLIHGNQDSFLSILETLNDNYFDLVLVDPSSAIPDRSILTKASIPKLKKGGYLVLDNYTKYGLSDVKLRRWKILTFDELKYSGRGTRICVKP